MNFLQLWFKRWAAWIERYLFGTALIVVALLVITQLIMTSPRARVFFNRTESLEGEPYHWFDGWGSGDSTAVDNIYWVELALRRGEGPLEVLINGSPSGILGSDHLIVYVKPGDLLEVRGDYTRDRPAVVEVVSTYGLASPEAGFQVTTYGDYDLIGWAVPRNKR